MHRLRRAGDQQRQAIPSSSTLKGVDGGASTLLVPDVQVGDWVYVAAGTVIERLDPAEAAKTNELLRSAQGALT